MIEIETRDTISMNNFVNELKELNIYTSLNANLESNPDGNYKVFERLLLYAKNTHLSKKTVKY